MPRLSPMMFYGMYIYVYIYMIIYIYIHTYVHIIYMIYISSLNPLFFLRFPTTSAPREVWLSICFFRDSGPPSRPRNEFAMNQNGSSGESFGESFWSESTLGRELIGWISHWFYDVIFFDLSMFMRSICSSWSSIFENCSLIHTFSR